MAILIDPDTDEKIHLSGPFYHSTTRRKASNILKTGLLVGRGDHMGRASNEIFMAQNPDLADAWGDTVLEITLPAEWELEMGEYYDTRSGEVTSIRNIPPEYIRLYRRLKLPPLKSEEELLEEFKSKEGLDINELYDFVRGTLPRSDRILRQTMKMIASLESRRLISMPDSAVLRWVLRMPKFPWEE